MMKHIEMNGDFVRERVESKEVVPAYVDTKNQMADMFTKALGT